MLSRVLAGVIWAASFMVQPALSQADNTLTGILCNPYRIYFEQAIQSGIIQRPSLVSGRWESLNKFRQSLQAGDRIGAAARAAQYLVIVSEVETLAQADLERSRLEEEITAFYQQPIEESLPLLLVILPRDIPCPVE